jgi:hypothetical protein
MESKTTDQTILVDETRMDDEGDEGDVLMGEEEMEAAKRSLDVNEEEESNTTPQEKSAIKALEKSPKKPESTPQTVLQSPLSSLVSKLSTLETSN